jgi:asparagine synthase (glutamine-hydrolysing)
VPFLDHRLLEYIARIPAEHHPELFMDKKIVRRAVADLLPPSIAERPKGYFYFGKEQHRTFQLMYAVLTGNDRELIDQAIAGSVASNGPINAERFHDYVTDVARDGQFAEIPRLLKLVNMGLLADMARKLEFDANLRRPAPVRELSAAELDQLIGSVGSTMPTDPKFIDQMVPKFCSGVELISNPDTGNTELKIAGKANSPIASPNWETFLKAMDGRRSVAEIVSTCKLPKNRIIRQLRESMKDGIITAESM